MSRLVIAPRTRRVAPTMNIGLFLTTLLLGLAVVVPWSGMIPTAPALPSTGELPTLPVSVPGEVAP